MKSATMTIAVIVMSALRCFAQQNELIPFAYYQNTWDNIPLFTLVGDGGGNNVQQATGDLLKQINAAGRGAIITKIGETLYYLGYNGSTGLREASIASPNVFALLNPDLSSSALVLGSDVRLHPFIPKKPKQWVMSIFPLLAITNDTYVLGTTSNQIQTTYYELGLRTEQWGNLDSNTTSINRTRLIVNANAKYLVVWAKSTASTEAVYGHNPTGMASLGLSVDVQINQVYVGFDFHYITGPTSDLTGPSLRFMFGFGGTAAGLQ